MYAKVALLFTPFHNLLRLFVTLIEDLNKKLVFGVVKNICR